MVCPIFFDDFADGVEDPLWEQTFGDSTTEVGGAAVVNVTAAANDQFTRQMVDAGPAGLEGATARLEVGAAPQDEGVYLLLWASAKESAWRIAFQIGHYGNEISLQVRITDNNDEAMIVSSVEWDPVDHHWLQLREETGNLYFEASDDGTNFTTVFTTPTTFDVTDALVGFVGFNNLALGNDVQVSVETFELMCGA